MEPVVSAGLTQALGNFALTGIAGAATTHSSAAIAYSIRGRCYTHTADTGVATPSVDAVTGSPITLTANNGRAVVWCLDATDANRCVAGPVCALDANGAFIEPPSLPAIPDTLCPVAITLHRAGSATGGTWTFGANNWNTTGLQHTVINISTLPDRVLLS